jgi:hypothetical protein
MSTIEFSKYVYTNPCMVTQNNRNNWWKILKQKKGLSTRPLNKIAKYQKMAVIT